QAEDGIRDLIVTGVQTCALPIWNPLPLIPSLRTFSLDAAVARVIATAGREERTLDLTGSSLLLGVVCILTDSLPDAEVADLRRRSEERRVGNEGWCAWMLS